MSELDRKFIDDQLEDVIGALIFVKENLSSGDHFCVDVVKVLHDNMSSLSFISFLIGQEYNNTMYKDLLPEEIFNDIEKELDLASQEDCEEDCEENCDDDEDECCCGECVCELPAISKDDKKMVN